MVLCDFCKYLSDNPPPAKYEVVVSDDSHKYAVYCCEECFQDEMYMFEGGLELVEYKEIDKSNSKIDPIALAIRLLKHYKKVKKYYDEVSKTKTISIEKLNEFRSIVQSDMELLSKEKDTNFYIGYIWSKLLGADNYFKYIIQDWDKGMRDMDYFIEGVEFALRQVHSAYKETIYQFISLREVFKKVY